jgi:hypothetical protein
MERGRGIIMINKSCFKGVICTSFLALGATSISARAAIIDFQQLEHVDVLTVDHGFQYVEDGFQLEKVNTDYNFSTYGTLESRYTGSTALFNNTGGSSTELTKVGGGAFDLLSIDLAKLSSKTGANVTFTANTGYSQFFTLVRTDYVAETFNFDSEFLGVTSVTWSQASPFHQFDNIVVSAIPVPAAVWLFSSGLLGLIGVAKRKARA